MADLVILPGRERTMGLLGANGTINAFAEPGDPFWRRPAQPALSLSGCDALPGAQKWNKESGIRGRPEDAWSRPVALATALEEAKDPV